MRPLRGKLRGNPPRAPLRGAPKGVKKRVKKKFPTLPCDFLGFFAIFRGAGRPSGAHLARQVARTPPPGGVKMRRFAAQPRNAAQHYCNGWVRKF